MVPYTKALSGSFKNIYSGHGAQVHFKGGRTIKDLLVACKDRDNIIQKSQVTYKIQEVQGHLKMPIQFMTFIVSQVTLQLLTTAVLWKGRTRTSLRQ